MSTYIHNNINVSRLISTMDYLKHKCSMVAGKQCTSANMHSLPWLFDKLMRFFSAEYAAESVNVPVAVSYIGNEYVFPPVNGEATIHRDGTVQIRYEQNNPSE